MNYYKIGLPFLMLLAFFSCAPDSQKAIDFDFELASRFEKFHINFQSEIDFHFPGKKDLVAPYSSHHDNKLYLIEKDSIAIFDLRKSQFIRRIGIDGEADPNHPFSGIHVMNPDSLIVFNSHNSFLLLDKDGKQRKTIVLKDFPYGSQVPTVFPSIRIQSQGQKIIFPFYLPDYDDFRWEHNETPRIAIYDLANDSTQLLAPTSPSAYIEKGYQLPISITHPDLLTTENRIFVSYPYDHIIETYDYKGQLLQRKKAASRYIHQFPAPMTDKEYTQQQKIFNYRSTMPHYGPLNYHKAHQLYSRIVYHEKELKDKDGKLVKGSLRNASILLLDEKMDIVGETFFETGSKGLTLSIPLPNGFLIAPNMEYWPQGETLAYIHRYHIQPNS